MTIATHEKNMKILKIERLITKTFLAARFYGPVPSRFVFIFACFASFLMCNLFSVFFFETLLEIVYFFKFKIIIF